MESTWTEAYDLARSMSYMCRTGYLATIQANSATVNYYTVSFSVTDARTASGSTVTAMAGDTAISSGTAILAGKSVVITATGAGATSYTYVWSGRGSNGETTTALSIASLNGVVDAECIVTGTIENAENPSTGQDFIWVWVLGAAAIAISGLAYLILNKHQSRTLI